MKTADQRPRCGTCPHFMRDVPNHCRLNPPVPIMVIKVDPLSNRPGQQLQGFWSPVGPDHHCGQHPDFMMWHMRNRGQVTDIDELDRRVPEASA